MAGLVLRPDDRAHFLVLIRRPLNSAVHRRLNVLPLLDDGWSVARIAAALYLDERTVAEHGALSAQGGRTGVERLSDMGLVSRLSADQRAAFGLSYAQHARAQLLGQIGFVLEKPTCVPAKADAAIRQAFLDTTLTPLMQAAKPEAPLYFVDGCHPSYIPRHRENPGRCASGSVVGRRHPVSLIEKGICAALQDHRSGTSSEPHCRVAP